MICTGKADQSRTSSDQSEALRSLRKPNLEICPSTARDNFQMGLSFSCDHNSFKRSCTFSLQSLIMTDQPQSLKELLQTAKAQKQSIEYSAEPNSDAYRQEVSATIDKLQECQRLISQLSLFSSNEGLEDISTSNLQYDLLKNTRLPPTTNNRRKVLNSRLSLS